jgi:tetratricopeptide (TPR) repeat protein
MLQGLLLVVVMQGLVPEVVKKDPVTLWSAQAIRHALAGEYQQAADCWTQALRSDPADAQLWVFRGMARGMAGDVKGAEADALTSLRLEPPDVKALLRRAEDAVDENDLPEAVALTTQALELKDDYAFAYALRAFALSRLGREAEAIKDLDRSIALHPVRNPALAIRGILHLNAGRIPQAKTDLVKVDRWCPADPHVQVLKIAVAMAEERWALVLELNRKWEGNNDYDGTRWMFVAMAQFNLGKYDDTLRAVELAISFDNRHLRLWQIKGAALIKLQRDTDAMTALDFAYENGFRTPELLHARGLVQHRLRRFEAAVTSFRDGVQAEPDSLKQHKGLLAALFASRETGAKNGPTNEELIEAAEAAMKVKASKAERAELCLDVGEYYSKLSDYAKARRFLDEAVKNEPADPERVFLARGRALLALHEYKRAAEDLDRAEPKYQSYSYLYAWRGAARVFVAESDGGSEHRYEPAWRDLCRALELNPLIVPSRITRLSLARYLDRPDVALQDSAELIKDPEHATPDVFITRGWAFLRKEQPQNAQECFEQCLKRCEAKEKPAFELEIKRAKESAAEKVARQPEKKEEEKSTTHLPKPGVFRER